MSAQEKLLVLDSMLARVKQEQCEHSVTEATGGLFTAQAHIEKPLPEMAVHVKVEPWEPGVNETVTDPGLYSHKLQGELEFGPECMQHPGIIYEANAASGQASWDRRASLGSRVVAKTHCEASNEHGGEKTVPPEIVDIKIQDTTNINYVCDTCGKEFLEKRYLIQHIKAHMYKNHDYLCNKSYSCEICKKRSKGMSNKKKTAVKKFSCKMCQKKFRRSDNFKVHVRTHTGVKPYACEICFTKFANQRTLKTHTQIHTGVKPYSCEICKQKFSQSGNLKRHTLVHTGEKPFCCEVCSKRFIGLSDLKRHTRIHTGDKPYACEICRKRFAVSSQLTRHKRIHARAKLFSCERCEMLFSRKCHLESHKRTHVRKKRSISRPSGDKENGGNDY